MATIRISRKHIALISLAIASGLAAPGAAEAGRDGYKNDADYVVAESRFGHGRVVGPVRHTSVGRQVRTPGGSWLHCARSCSETLRVNTVDFWENQGSHRGTNIDNEDGVLGSWLRRRGF